MFHNVRFPEEISYGSKGGPKFSTTIITLASGKERRNINWMDVRAEYDVAHGIKDQEEMEELRDFFYGRYGRAYSFRFKDHADYQIFSQTIGIGDGTTTQFQIVKSYTSGVSTYMRRITKPVSGTLTGGILVDDVEAAVDSYTVDYNTGVVTFDVAPAAAAVISIPYVEFDVHARFDTDYFDPVHEFWLTESWQSILIVEIKDDETV